MQEGGEMDKMRFDLAKFLKARKMSKKGQLDNYINIFVGAGLSLLFLTVIVIVISAFQDTQANTSAAYGVLNNTLGMFTNLTAQFTTIGTVGGVLALLVILSLVGVWGYGKVKENM